jgi:YjbR protein
MTPDTFRRLALGLPQAYESRHMDHPDFRIGKRIFATLGYPSHGWGMVKLTPLQQSQFTKAFPDVFAPVKGAWGLRGATKVHLRSATLRTLKPAMLEAWSNMAPPGLVADLTDARSGLQPQ